MISKVVSYIVDLIFKILGIIGLISVVFCILACYVAPSSVSIFQFFGLIAPIIILLNVVIALYWVIRMQRFVILSIVSVLLCIIPANKLYNFDFKNKTNTEEKADLKVVSYNVMNFTDKTYRMKNIEILRELATINPNILCFQEFATTGKNTYDKVNSYLYKLYNKRVFYTKKYTRISGLGLAIYSTYPIINSKQIPFEGSNNGAMWADIRIKKDTIRVFNLHLQTTNVNRDDMLMLSDKDIISSMNSDGDMNKIKFISSKVFKNNKIREKQVKLIRKEIEKSPHRVIVCGDFNDTPNSYSYGVLRSGFKDAFMEKGKGYGYTFKEVFSMLRIDFVFTDKSIDVVNYSLGKELYSDHYPVVVGLNL